MNLAQRIRELFSILFGSRRVEELHARIADLTAERDRANARASRYELILLTPREPRPTIPRRPGTQESVGRKTWAQVQAEHLEKQRKEAEAEAAAKKAAGAN